MTFWDRMTELKNETNLKAKREKREKKIEFKEQLKEFKEKNDVEKIIEIISKALQESVCDLIVLHKVLGMTPEQHNDGAEVWKIADFVRANIADINIEAIVIEEEELNFPVSETISEEQRNKILHESDSLKESISSHTRKTLEALVLDAAISVPAGLLTKVIMYQNHTRNEIEKCLDNNGDGIDDGKLIFTEDKIICLPSKALETIRAREYKKDPSNEDPRIEKEPRVYVPPDPGKAICVKEGDLEYLPAKFIPRLKYLEEVLQSLEVDMFKDCEIWIGTNTANMMRILSYMIVLIPAKKVVELIKSKEGVEIEETEVKERMVLLCEEEGNRTFIIDKIGDVESEYLKNNELAEQEFHYYTDKTKNNLKALSNIINLIWCEPASTWKEKVKSLLTSKKILSRNFEEYYTPENILHDLEALAEVIGLDHPTQLNTENIESVPITCSTGEPEVKGERYLINAAIALFGYVKNTREAKSMKSTILKELKKIAGFEDRLDEEYYSPKNLAHEEIGKNGEVIKTGDLWEFTKAVGLKHPTQLNTKNIRSGPIACSNGEPEVRGETYLKHAVIALGIKGGSATLKELKKIAGFEDRLDKEYYTPENILHDLEAFTEAAGLKHPTQLSTENIKSVPITCSNGEPDVKGDRYLRHAVIALGIKGGAAILKELKKIAGFEE